MEDSGPKRPAVALFILDYIRHFFKRCKSIISRLKGRNSKGKVDLDDELRRQNPHPPGLAVKKDNWKVSSDKARADQKWGEKKDSLGLGAFDVPGQWEYNREKNERFWIDRARQSATHQGSGVPSKIPSGGPFEAFDGDREVSYLYRKFWLGGNASTTFLDKIYHHHAVSDTIPEMEIWKIWRCLVGELVPAGEAWEGAPSQILANPDTLWQTGKCVFQILTRGRFFDNKLNILRLVDSGEKFGDFKVAVLHKAYSQNLLKFVLSCLSSDPHNRPTREMLMNHFEDVLAIFARGPTSKPVKEPEPKQPPAEEPYHSTNGIIPKGLTKAYGSVYKTILKVVNERVREGRHAPRIVVITDLAKDFDDLLAMIALKELHRLGVIQLEGFIANLYPAEKRARLGRGALDSLGLSDIPMAKGTHGEESLHDVLGYEFEGSESFIAPEGTDLDDGQELLHRIFTKAKEGKYKVTILAISSLMDIAKFAENELELLKGTLGKVVLQGGYNVRDGKLQADSAAANNMFDSEGAKFFHEFLWENEVPSTCFTKVATFATPIYQTFLVELEKTGVNVGVYLRAVQLGQDLHYWNCASGPEEGRFRNFMDEPWFLTFKTTWYDKHEFDEPGPPGDKITPWLDKVTAYDCLAAIGAAGEDILDALGVLTPLTTRPDANHPIHKIVGVPPVADPDDKTKNILPQDVNVNGETFATAIEALVLGSLLSVVQKI